MQIVRNVGKRTSWTISLQISWDNFRLIKIWSRIFDLYFNYYKYGCVRISGDGKSKMLVIYEKKTIVGL